jgi:hypothetical protein
MRLEVDAAVRSRLASYKASLAPAQLDELVLSTQKLLARQNTPDPAEELEKLPK